MPQQDKSLGELFADLSRETSTLVRQEVQLAKTELTQNATTAAKNAALLVVGGVLAFVGFEVLMAAAVLALAQTLSPWQAALIVAAALLLIAGLLAFKGVSALKAKGLAPRQTVETIKEDVQWAKQQMH